MATTQQLTPTDNADELHRQPTADASATHGIRGTNDYTAFAQVHRAPLATIALYSLTRVVPDQGHRGFQGLIDAIFSLATAHLFRNWQAGPEVYNPLNPETVTFELRIISQTTDIANQLVSINAIRTKQMTRRKAAELTGVHENTIARWVKDPDVTSKLIQRLAAIFVEQLSIITGLSSDELTETDPVTSQPRHVQIRKELFANTPLAEAQVPE